MPSTRDGLIVRRVRPERLSLLTSIARRPRSWVRGEASARRPDVVRPRPCASTALPATSPTPVSMDAPCS